MFTHFHFNKKLYRVFYIKNDYPNEYQAFEEILTRCYSKNESTSNVKEEENSEKPDLILVDGGIGQWNKSFKTLYQLKINIPLGALQKNTKHQLEKLIIKNKVIILAQTPHLFHFLTTLSEEVHRFTVKFHHKTKNKLDYQTTLSKIKGIGFKRQKTILNHFKNIGAIQKASWQDFQKIGISKKLFKKKKSIL